MKSKHTFRLGVREHWRWMSERRLHASSCAHRPCSRADVSPDCHIPAQGKCFDSVFAIEDDDEICDIGAYLKAPP